MIIQKNIERPDWTKILKNKKIDLTKNVHHDRILNEKIKKLIFNSDFLVNYANDSNLYNAICGYYKIPVHLQKGYAQYGNIMGDFEISENVSKKILSLPMHPYLDKNSQDKVLNVLNGIV